MNFARLNAEFLRLRQSISTFAGENALGEITIQPPAAEEETSFLRLVAWSYALIYEVGRVSIPYLLNLPSGRSCSQKDARRARVLVNSLRTWLFHNLGYQNKRSIQISSQVSLWFVEKCGTNSPNTDEEWQRCFEALCAEVMFVLIHSRDAFAMVLTGPENGRETIDDLRHRLDRNWPAFWFDRLVNDAATRMGLSLEVTKFRESRLEEWRRFLETIPEDDNPEVLVGRLIERDILVHVRYVIPIDSSDVMLVLGIEPGDEVLEYMRFAYRLFDQGITNRQALLAELETIKQRQFIEQG